MNEHILKLTVQAKLGCADFKDGTKYFVGTEETFSAFAELIVRECIGALNKRFMGDLNREDMEVRRCIDDVKKHFGIEE